jgi:rRNA maturation endonuclease Nob1
MLGMREETGSETMRLRCLRCWREFEGGPETERCPKCRFRGIEPIFSWEGRK